MLNSTTSEWSAALCRVVEISKVAYSWDFSNKRRGSSSC